MYSVDEIIDDLHTGYYYNGEHILEEGLDKLRYISKYQVEKSEYLRELLFRVSTYRLIRWAVRSQARSMIKHFGYSTPTDLFRSLSRDSRWRIIGEILGLISSGSTYEELLKGFGLLGGIPKEDFKANEDLRAALFYWVLYGNEEISSKAKSVAEDFDYSPVDLFKSLSDARKEEIIGDAMRLVESSDHSSVLELLKLIGDVSQEDFDKDDYLRQALFFFSFSSNKPCAEMARTVSLSFGYPTPTDLFRSLSNDKKEKIIEEIPDLITSSKFKRVLRGLKLLKAIPKEDFKANEDLRAALLYSLSYWDEEISSKAKSVAEHFDYPTPTDLFRSLSNDKKEKIIEEILDLLNRWNCREILQGLKLLKAIPKEDFQKNENLKETLLYTLFYGNEDVRAGAKSVVKHFDCSPVDLFRILGNDKKEEIIGDAMRLVESSDHSSVLERLKLIEGVSQEEFDKNDYLRQALFFFSFSSNKPCAEMARTVSLSFGYPTPTDLFKSLSNDKKEKIMKKISRLLRSISSEKILQGLKLLKAIPKEDFQKNENLKETLFDLMFDKKLLMRFRAKVIAKYLGYPTPTDLFKSLSNDKKEKIIEEMLNLITSSKFKRVLRGLKLLKAIPKQDFKANEGFKKALFDLMFDKKLLMRFRAKVIAKYLGYPTPTDLFRSLSEPNKKEIVDRILEDLHGWKYWVLQGLETLRAIPKKDFDANENLKKTLFYLLFRVDGDIRTEAESVIAHFDYTPETFYNSLQNKQERDKLVVKIMDKLSDCLRKERDPENSVAFELLSKLRGILQRAQATDDASTVAHKDFAFGSRDEKKGKERGTSELTS